MGKGFVFLLLLLAVGLFAIFFGGIAGKGSNQDFLSAFALNNYLDSRDLSDFQDGQLYVQFITPANMDGLSLFSKVVDNWHTSGLKIVALFEDEATIKNKISLPTRGNVHYIKIKQMRKTTRQFLRSGAFFIFGKRQELLRSGMSSQGYDNYVKISLMELVEHDPFRVEEFIPAGKKLIEIPHFSALSSRLTGIGKRYHLVALFNELCSSCKTGQLTQYLNRLYSEPTNSRLDIFSVLNSGYNSESDKDALISQSRVVFPIYLSDIDLTNRWQFYIQKYNRQLLNDLLILIDEEGRIERVLDTACNCDAEFFGRVNELLDGDNL